MPAPHLPFCVIPRLPRPAARIDAAEKRGKTRKSEQEARNVMQTSHPLFSVFPRLLRPTARNDAAENAEKR